MMLIEFDALAESLLALTGKSIAPTLDRAGNGSAKPSLASFVTIRPYIDRNLAMPYLSAESIAAAFGLSRLAGSPNIFARRDSTGRPERSPQLNSPIVGSDISPLPSGSGT